MNPLVHKGLKKLQVHVDTKLHGDIFANFFSGIYGILFKTLNGIPGTLLSGPHCLPRQKMIFRERNTILIQTMPGILSGLI